MRWLALCLTLTAQAALAETPGEIADALILPALDRFVGQAAALEAAAQADCTAGALRPAYDAAFDAWAGAAVYRLGPTEEDGLNIAFWPDEKGLTPMGLRALLERGDEAALADETFSAGSVAVRGFMALDQMLGDADLSSYGAGSFACRLVQAIAADLSRSAVVLRADWRGFAEVIATAGDKGNATFLTGDEATRALYTQLLAGIELAADQRLGRPLGTFDRPRPTRAEGWRTRRPLRNVSVALDALQPLARAVKGGDVPATDAAFAAVRAAIEAVPDPTLQDIDDPQAWLKAEIVQQRLRSLHDTVVAEVGGALGIEAGFNSLDGD